MKRFFAEIGRFFWSWGFLKFVLWTITIIVFFYIEEDWRGARAWAATKAEWEAKGESFDYSRLVPPLVPDAQNLAMIPLFKLEPDTIPENKGELAPLALRKAYRADNQGHNPSLPHAKISKPGEVADMENVRRDIADEFAETFKGMPSPPGDSLGQFDALYPFVAELRADSLGRPYSRFPHEYPPQPPYHDLLSLVTSQIQVAKILAIHALLALNTHQPELALSDLQINFKIAGGLLKEPFIVSGLVAIGMTAIDFGAVHDGLALHAWNDAQLAQLQDELGRLDFLNGYQSSLRGELALMVIQMDQLKSDRNYLQKSIQEYRDYAKFNPKHSTHYDSFPDFWPNGWFDLNNARMAEEDLTAVHYVDPDARRVFPERVDEFAAEIEKQRSDLGALFPWRFFAVSVSTVLTGAAQKYSYMQAQIDEARIVCGLERYRLVHDVYPDSLDALVPTYLTALPLDVISGQPYKYQLRPDGNFLLYSVGWNQTDEGGKVAYKKDFPNAVDYSAGDWTWPVPQAAPVKSP